ncbi:MAG TPA: amino acid permease [Fastidiosipila sp.]|nr:amino acid permease [Fastidiosipila sp.]
MDKKQDNQLKRQLNLLDATGIGVGAVVGAGIFVITGVAAAVTGPSLMLALFLAAIAATCNGLSSAQLAAEMPTSGGTYVYASRKISPHAGFAAGFMFLLSKLSAGSVVALGFGHAFAAFVPGVSPFLVTSLLILLLTVLNLFGIKKAGHLNVIIVALTVGALLLFSGRGLADINMSNFQPFFKAGVPGLLEAAALMFFAFTGYARITTLGDEVLEPKRTIPRAVILTLAITSVLYMLVAFVSVGVLGSERLAAGDAPLFNVASAIGDRWLVTVLSLASLTALFGVLLSQIAGISRMGFAMAKGGDLPKIFADVKRNVPYVGILSTGVIIWLLSLIGSIPLIAMTASFSILLYYSLANLSALRQSKEHRIIPRAIPVIGLLSCITLAVSLPWQTILVGLSVLAVGYILRHALKRLARYEDDLADNAERDE